VLSLEIARKYIRFSTYWDKLQNLKVGGTFTTIRGPDKFKYYYDMMRYGEMFVVLLNEKNKNPVSLAVVKIISIESKVMKELTPEEIKADTYSWWTFDTFLVAMRRFYKWKEWWDEGNTRLTKITFRVVRVMT
jgi:hypothetical protein